MGGRGAGRAVGGGGAAEALVAVAHEVGRPLRTRCTQQYSGPYMSACVA